MGLRPRRGNHLTLEPGNHLTLEPGNHLTPELGNHLAPELGNHLALTASKLGNCAGPRQSKAPIQKVADKLAGRLVYLAFGGAVITYLVTHDIVSAIAALIVAGACGVAAGTPLAVLAGIGRTAKEGIIVKGGVYIEQLSKVDTIIFDKTGTLTFGNPEVMGIQNFNGISKEQVLQIAACAEQHSEHPLAEAIMRKAKTEKVAYESYADINYLPGLGMI
ncbi:MAG: HAD family hydrolase, partial [bacterium]